MSKNHSEWHEPPALPHDHFVSSQIYTDAGIFEEERRKIHWKTWKFACHLSELPEVGSYRLVDYAGLPLVILRGRDNQVRSFVNSCPHRGATLLTRPAGTANGFRCFFHLWNFDTLGNCTGMTRPEGYSKVGLEPESCSLRGVRTEIHLGMVFVNLDDGAKPLKDYVGDVLASVEEAIGTVDLEVFHYHKGYMRANWKQWHETNMELYHEWGHVVNRTTSILAPGYHDRKWYIHPEGHGTLSPLAVKYTNYRGWDERNDKNLPGVQAGEFRIVDLFPNTTIIIRGTVARIDTSTPLAPGLTLVEHRGLGVKGESAEDRLMRQKHHNQFWGPFGRNLAEDVHFVEAVETSNRSGASRYGIFARHEDLDCQDDEIMRAYYRVWQSYMGLSPSDPKSQESLKRPAGAPLLNEGKGESHR